MYYSFILSLIKIDHLLEDGHAPDVPCGPSKPRFPPHSEDDSHVTPRNLSAVLVCPVIRAE